MLECFVIHGKRISANGIALPAVVEPRDVWILEQAQHSGRLEWEGHEALRTGDVWTIFVQTDKGLRKVATRATISSVWLYVNNWQER